jgi:hypothetical protein
MARYLIATHRAALTRDWRCARCNVHGQVIVQACGKGEKRLWFSRSAAAEVAHDRATAALERDGDRIAALVRCPQCHARAPGASVATVWHGLGNLVSALLGGAVVAAVVAARTASLPLAILLMVVTWVVVVGVGDERRRWTAAGRAQLTLDRTTRKPTAAPQRQPATAAGSPETSPFRAPPAPSPIVVVPPPALVDVRTPIVAGDPADRPTILT